MINYNIISSPINVPKQPFMPKYTTKYFQVSKTGKKWSFLPANEYTDGYKIFDTDENDLLTIR